MEYFGARLDQPLETWLAEVARSNMLVVIIGYRYGSLVPGKQTSFSEAVYIRDNDVPILPKDFETDPRKLRLLSNFKAVLNTAHTVAKFRGPEDLAERVKADLLNTIETAQRSSEQAEDQRAEFFSEIRAIVENALSRGFQQMLVLSALRNALEELEPRPPSLSVRVAAFLREWPPS